MTWKTFRDNGMSAVGPTGHRMDLRIVFDKTAGDVAYVVPDSDNDNGNANARLIAAAPDLFNACQELWDAVTGCGSDVPDDVMLAAQYCRLLCLEITRGDLKGGKHGR